MRAFFVFLLFTRLACGEEKTLCGVDEVMIASCHLDESKHRVISICGEKSVEKVFYRFGKEKEIELAVEFSRYKKLSRWVDLGTYTTYFGFRRGQYSYIFGVPEEAYGAKAFLKVKRNEEKIMSRNCVENSFGEKLMKSPSIDDVEDRVIRGNGLLFPPR